MAEVEVDTKKLKDDIKLPTEIQCEDDWSVTDDHAIMVAKSEQVQTLRECLKGHPLSMVSANIKDIEVAFGMFPTVFGDSARMLLAKKVKLVTLGKLPKPGSKVPSHYALRIDWCLQMEVLIKDLFPYVMVAEMIGKFSGDAENKIKIFLTYNKAKRAEVQGMLRESPGSVNVGSGSGGGPGKI